MAYRRLLLPLTGTAAGEAALATALSVARIWNAHVHCLHVRVDARDVAPLAGEGLSGAMIEEMMAATERESGERANRVRALFERFTGHAGGVALANSAETALKTDGPTLSFESIAGREEDVVAQQTRVPMVAGGSRGAISTGRPESNSTACSASEDETSSSASGCGTTAMS